MIMPRYEYTLQTDIFVMSFQRCREAGIEANFPPVRIPDDWWQDRKSRQALRGKGYPPPDRFSTAESTSKSDYNSSDESDSDSDEIGIETNERPVDRDEGSRDQSVSDEDSPFPGVEETSSGVPAQQVRPTPSTLVTLSQPVRVPPANPAPPPTTTAGIGIGNGGAGPSNVTAVGLQRRGFRGFLRGLSCL